MYSDYLNIMYSNVEICVIVYILYCFRGNMYKMLSAIYGKLLVIIGFALLLLEVVSEQVPQAYFEVSTHRN